VGTACNTVDDVVRLTTEFEAARTGEASRLDTERRRAEREAAIAAATPTRRSSGHPLLAGGDRLVHRAGRMDRRRRLGPLLMAQRQTGIDFGRTLYARSAEERITALDNLIRDLETAIGLCRDYETRCPGE
jgi:hypothetical protein